MTHRYSFSGAAVTDSIGGAAYTGTLQAGASISNGQLFLTSNSQYVTLPVGTIPKNATSFSLEAWATTAASSGGSGWNRLFAVYNPISLGEITVSRSQSTLGLGSEWNTVLNTQFMKYYSNPSFPFDGQTNIHVVLTVTIGDFARLYLNGVLYATSTSAITSALGFFNQNKQISIGCVAFSSLGFVGSMSEFRVWQGALQQADITAHFSAGPDVISGVHTILLFGYMIIYAYYINTFIKKRFNI